MESATALLTNVSSSLDSLCKSSQTWDLYSRHSKATWREYIIPLLTKRFLLLVNLCKSFHACFLFGIYGYNPVSALDALNFMSPSSSIAIFTRSSQICSFSGTETNVGATESELRKFTAQYFTRKSLSFKNLCIFSHASCLSEIYGNA
jgi:hypothetical protein